MVLVPHLHPVAWSFGLRLFVCPRRTGHVAWGETPFLGKVVRKSSGNLLHIRLRLVSMTDILMEIRNTIDYYRNRGKEVDEIIVPIERKSELLSFTNVRPLSLTEAQEARVFGVGVRFELGERIRVSSTSKQLLECGHSPMFFENDGRREPFCPVCDE